MMLRGTFFLLLFAAAGTLLSWGYARLPVAQAEGASGETAKPAAGPLFPAGGPLAEDHPALHNLLQLTETIYSGSDPKGDAAFESLARLGITTVVSVDGARPDVETARKHGLRYVHIPIGYDGIDEAAGRSLARLARDVAGPIYVHCHHGVHRGPAAAAVACIAAGAAGGQEALAILERAGTSKNYAGLWRDVENYQRPAPDAELPELVEFARVDSFAAAMASLDRSADNLLLFRDAGWGALPEHPDLVAAQEALLVREGLRESARLTAGDYDERFHGWMAEGEALAQELEHALRAADFKAATEQLLAVRASCTQCHRAYRN